MEKKLYDLTVEPKFERLCPPLREAERVMLEESIVANGCEMPLIVWAGKNIIVDGHNRYAICKAHGIPFAVEEKEFGNEDTVIYWLVMNQLGRRNLSSYAKCELVIPMEDALKRVIDERRRENVAETWRAKAAGEEGSGPNRAPNQKTRDMLASMAGVSHGTFDRAKKVIRCADEETKELLRKGEKTIYGVYTSITAEEKKTEAQPDPDEEGQEADAPQPWNDPDPQPTQPGSSSLSPLLDRPIVTDPTQRAHIDGPITFNPVAPEEDPDADEPEDDDDLPFDGDGGAEAQVREMADDFLEELNEVLETADAGEVARILELVREMGDAAEAAVRSKMNEED